VAQWHGNRLPDEGSGFESRFDENFFIPVGGGGHTGRGIRGVAVGGGISP